VSEVGGGRAGVVCNALKHFCLPYQNRRISPLIFQGNIFMNEGGINILTQAPRLIIVSLLLAKIIVSRRHVVGTNR
jgi:hypothetical protein